MAPSLEFRLLGGLTIGLAGERPLQFQSRRAEILIAYLAMTPSTQKRDTLSIALWDDREVQQAKANLRSLLAQLPKAIRPYLTITRKTISINPEANITVDALTFTQTIKDPHPEQIVQAVQQYQGPFLDGVFVRDSRWLEEWTAVDRARLQREAFLAHQHLAQHYLYKRAYPKGLKHAHALIQLDPLNEDGQQLLMRLLVRNQQHNAALAQYHKCVQLLDTELGIEPAPETTHLYERILQAKQPPAHKIPQQFTPFVGRGDELEMIARTLDDPTCRLLTLAGAGGAGKSRLAIQAAHERQGDYLNGIYFVPLAPFDQVSEIPGALATLFRLELNTTENPFKQLINYLRAKEILLILDNFEQFLPQGRDLIQQILTDCPHLQIMITTRTQLQLASEKTILVRGLPLPDIATDVAMGAVQLFVSRAQQRDPFFTLNKENKTAVYKICHLIEGLPLAIELAAASLSQFTAPQIAHEIQTNLDFLATPIRDVPARHRSLHAIFAYSWALLSQQEQHIYAQLAIFRGGFTLAAAKAITNASTTTIHTLMAKSLLRQRTHGKYETHEILRQYAAAELTKLPTVETAVKNKHSHHYTQFLADRNQKFSGDTLIPTLNQIESEQANIRIAWQHATASKDTQAIQSSLESLALFFYIRGFAQEGKKQFSITIDQLLSTPTSDKTNTIITYLIAWQALFLNELGLFDEAIQMTQTAVTHTTPPSIQTKALSQYNLGYAQWAKGAYETAQTTLNQALLLAQKTSLIWLHAQCLVTLGNVQLDLSDLSAAKITYQHALQLAQKEGLQRTEARLYNNLGTVYWQQGNYQQARTQFETALTVCRSVGIRQIEGLVLTNIGLVLSEMGNNEEALPYLHNALQISQEVGDRRGEGNTLLNLVAIAIEQAEYSQALAQGHRALDICQQIGDKQGEAIVRDSLGIIALQIGDFPQAKREFNASITLYEEIGDPLGLAHTLVGVALLYHRLEQQETAVNKAQHAIHLSQETDAPVAHATALTVLGHALTAQQKYTKAKQAFQQAIIIRQKIGQEHLAIEPLAGIAHLHHQQGNPQRSDIEPILTTLADHDLDGLLEPFRIHLICHQILRATTDPRAADFLSAAQTNLQARTHKIQNKQRRESYLHNVAYRHKLLTDA